MKLRISFLSIAASLFIVASILSLSAYISGEDAHPFSFDVIGPESLGFELTGVDYENASIMPGTTVDVNLVASVSGEENVFAFVGMDVPPEFTINGFQSESWHPIEEGSNIYFYGTDDKCVALGPENGSSAPVFSSLTLSNDVKEEAHLDGEFTGYFIQAENISEETAPATIYGMVGE